MVDWHAIVGEALCQRCVPLKLSFPDRARRCEGTLTLQVEPAWALEVQHFAPQLIERINASLGYRAVARLALRQAPLGRSGIEESRREARPRSPQNHAAEDDRLAVIDDEGLRGALAGLGRSLQTRGDS